MATATVPLGDLTSEQMRVLGELARAYGDGTVRVTIDQNLVFRWVQRRRRPRAVPPAVGGRPRPRRGVDDRRRHELPGRRVVPAGGHAVARPRAACSRTTCARVRISIAAADGARIKISGCPNGCGQHHIATIGFQGSVRRVGARAVPQYFVMVGGGTTDRRRQLRADRGEDSGAPHPRGGRAADRASTSASGSEGESAPAFFQRVDLARVTSELHDLQRLTEADAVPLDFVDLAETAEFAPEVMDGECSA